MYKFSTFHEQQAYMNTRERFAHQEIAKLQFDPAFQLETFRIQLAEEIIGMMQAEDTGYIETFKRAGFPEDLYGKICRSEVKVTDEMLTKIALALGYRAEIKFTKIEKVEE